MKKTALSAFLIMAVLAGTTDLGAQATTNWTKSATGYWAGDDSTWYKINPSDYSLWSSLNNKDWTAAKDGLWEDKDGKWLRVSEKRLMISSDNGTSWTPVKNNVWHGVDNTWYMFDNNWNLYTMSDSDYTKYCTAQGEDKNKEK